MLDRVAELHSNSPGSKNGKNKQLIEDVIKTSEDIVNNSTKIDVTKHPQSLNVLTRQVHNTITSPIPGTVINIHNDQVFDVPDNDDEYSEENLVNKSMNDLVALVLKFRKEMVKAEDKIAHMEILIAQKDKNYSELETKLAVVRQDLIVSKNAEVKYMAAGDKAALEKKKVTEGTAAEIIEGLKQFLSNKLSPLQTILASVESIN